MCPDAGLPEPQPPAEAVCLGDDDRNVGQFNLSSGLV